MGRCILAASEESPTVRLWDFSSGELERTFENHKGMVKTLEFSPDGIHLASGGSDSLILLQDASTGEVQRSLKGHRNTIYDLAWFVSGNQLASAAFDRTARVWKL